MHRMLGRAGQLAMAGGFWLAPATCGWAQGPAGTGPAAGSVPIEPKSFFEIVFSGGWVGISIMIVLIDPR